MFIHLLLFKLIFEKVSTETNETFYKFIEASNNEILQKYLPLWASGMIRIERDGSRSKNNKTYLILYRMIPKNKLKYWTIQNTINYLHGKRQSLNLYFKLSQAARRQGAFNFSVSINNWESCSCVTDRIYENLLPFAYNRLNGRGITQEEVVLLSWNFWLNQRGEKNFYFSGMIGQQFESEKTANWTDLPGMHRRATVLTFLSGKTKIFYGKNSAELDSNKTSFRNYGKTFRIRIISQKELRRLFTWLPEKMTDGNTPYCDWNINIPFRKVTKPSDLQLLIPEELLNTLKIRKNLIFCCSRCLVIHILMLIGTWTI
ncbi:hypothetical protein Mgra_00006448 [Meloidogyne graminicola]|uniref:Uncharacterized protein n=1 Tax=Meloidogyne graminicola TaxID=189291 RepID=A0A8S9ZLC2_9BILA|nr:hypothetical protein Mgra_00006448 [Meloidogyne graminicola]